MVKYYTLTKGVKHIMVVKLNYYNVESEVIELIAPPVGKDGNVIERQVSKDALAILMDKVEKNDLSREIPDADRALVEAVYQQGGMKWVEQEINNMSMF